MGDARIPKIAGGVGDASSQSADEAALQRLSGLLKPLLRSHLSPKAIGKLVRDPRLQPFFRDLFATHRPDEILKIEVISQRGQILIRATLNKQVTQCGVDSSRDGYSEKRECTTSNVVTSESTLKLDRNYVARLNARPRPHIHTKPKPPTEVASVTEVVKLAPSQSVVILRDPSNPHAPGTLMHELTRKLTPREKLGQDIFREGVAVDELRQQEAERAEASGSVGIVLETRHDTEQLNRQIGRANQSAAQKVANLLWVNTDKVPPGQMGSSLHRIFVNRSAKWEKLLGRDAKVLPVFEEVRSDFRADRQLVADIVMLVASIIPGPAVPAQVDVTGRGVDSQQILPAGATIAGKLLEGTYANINQETASRVIWVHAWLGKLVRHPDILTDEALQGLSPTARKILIFGMRRWGRLAVYRSYHPIFRNIEQHHFRALIGRWAPDTIVHLSAFPTRYLFLTNWVAEVGRTRLGHRMIASQLKSEEYEILHTMIGGGRFDIADEKARLASLKILELAQESFESDVTASRSTRLPD